MSTIADLAAGTLPMAIPAASMQSVRAQLGAVPGGAIDEPVAIDANGILIVPIHGLLVRRPAMAQELRAMGLAAVAYAEICDFVKDTAPTPLILDINSFGGMVAGLEKCINTLWDNRHRIRAAAITDAGTSAAYFLAGASGCKIYAADADTLIGGIGIIIDGGAQMDSVGDTRSAYKNTAAPLAQQETAEHYAGRLYPLLTRARGDDYTRLAGRVVAAGQDDAGFLIDGIGEITIDDN